MRQDALNLKTLPKYVYYENGQARDALAEIKETNDDLQTIVERYKDKFGSSLSYEKDIAYLWILYSPAFNNINKDYQSMVLLSMEGQTNFPHLVDFYENNQGEQEEYRQELNKELESFLQGAQTEQQLLNIEIPPEEIDPFDLKKVQRLLTLDIQVPSANFLLNILECTILVPFLKTEDFHKVYTQTNFDKEWENIDVPPDSLVALYKNNTFYFLISETGVELFYEIDVESFEEEMNARDIILGLFPQQVDYIIKEGRITGNFQIQNQTFLPPVFSDLCFTDPVFRSLLVINEREKATRLRKSSLFVRYRSEEIGLLTFSMLKLGTNAIRIRVSRAENLEKVNLFQKRLLQLMRRYNQRQTIVIQDYQKFFPDFGSVEDQEDDTQKEKSLKDIAPDLFLSKYTRKCSYLPVILTDEEAKEKEPKEVMLFPKTPQEGAQYFYYCPNPNAPYPGLRKNPMANKDKYPFIPCCYVDDQARKKNSPYNQYYSGASVIDTVNIQRRLTTAKFVAYNQEGVIPKEFNQLFSVFIGKPVDITRTGVHNSMTSLLECILMQQQNVGYMQSDNQVAYLQKERERLVNYELAVCKQEWYDKPLEFLRMKILDQTTYLDPRDVIRLVEHVYNCECIILTRSKEGFLDVFRPPYSKYHVQYNFSRPKIYIYEHWGSESDMATTPRCELLLVDETVSPAISQVYDLVQRFFIDGKRVVPQKMAEVSIDSQLVDQFGKLRGLNLSSGGTVLTDPLPPLPVPISKEITIVDQDDLKETMQELDIQDFVITSTTVKGRSGTVNIDIPLVQPFQEKSALRSFNRSRQLAQYLVQLVRYLFARMLVDKDLLQEDRIWINNTLLYEEFRQQYIEINPDYTYTFPLPIEFDTETLVVYVYDEDTADRLMYDLIRYTTHYTPTFQKYPTMTFVPKEFDQVSDFKQIQNNIVLKN